MKSFPLFQNEIHSFHVTSKTVLVCVLPTYPVFTAIPTDVSPLSKWLWFLTSPLCWTAPSAYDTLPLLLSPERILTPQISAVTLSGQLPPPSLLGTVRCCLFPAHRAPCTVCCDCYLQGNCFLWAASPWTHIWSFNFDPGARAAPCTWKALSWQANLLIQSFMGEESRCRNRRTWSSPPPTNTSKILIHVDKYLLNGGRISQTPKIARKIST